MAPQVIAAFRYAARARLGPITITDRIGTEHGHARHFDAGYRGRPGPRISAVREPPLEAGRHPEKSSKQPASM